MQPSAALSGALDSGRGKTCSRALAPAPDFTRAPLGLGLSTRRARPAWERLLEDPREAHLSTAPHSSHPYPWLSCSDEDRRRPQGRQQPPPQGASAPERLGLQEVSGLSLASGASGPAAERSQRFPASDRLRKRFQFRLVRDRSRRVHTKSFLVLVAPSEALQTRLGITVARQVGKAVRRNRIKRLVREAFRQRRELFPIRADVVVIAKNNCAVSCLADVEAEFIDASRALLRARPTNAHPPTKPGGAR
jgi:ribonuclease P protein component